MKIARNVAIILAIAGAVAFLPGGWPAATFFATLLSILMLTGLVWFAGRMYMEHRIDLFSLGDRSRALLYGAVAVIVLTLTASRVLLATGIGIVVWLALICGAVFALFSVWRARRDYGY
ncbi:MAG: hypothetical protein ACR2ML_02270 [Solirubrobacteraceae bacterium]